MKIALAAAALIIAALGLGSATADQYHTGAGHLAASGSPTDLGWGGGSGTRPPVA